MSDRGAGGAFAFTAAAQYRIYRVRRGCGLFAVSDCMRLKDFLEAIAELGTRRFSVTIPPQAGDSEIFG